MTLKDELDGIVRDYYEDKYVTTECIDLILAAVRRRVLAVEQAQLPDAYSEHPDIIDRTDVLAMLE